VFGQKPEHLYCYIIYAEINKEGAVLSDDKRALERMRTHCSYSETLINGPFVARVLASYANYALMQRTLQPTEITKSDTEWLKEMGIMLFGMKLVANPPRGVALVPPHNISGSSPYS
jgi:hypothetical protein